MNRLDPAAAATMRELEQMMVGYWREVDFNGAADAVGFFTEDVVGAFGAIAFTGHDGVREYYAARAAKIEAEQGVRTTRHVYHNLHVVLDAADRATLEFLVLTYGGAGTPPILGGTMPVAISDTRMECRREADGRWRIHGFYGTPVFVGTESFARTSLIGNS